MSIPKVIGIEQEYAIKIKGDQSISAFDATCMLVNCYARKLGFREPDMRILWDYGHETPYQDIRGELFGKIGSQQVVSDEENRLINASLPNGARFYNDHAHPEYATPECLSARDALACDKAGETVLLEALDLMQDTMPAGAIALFKNNTDHQGHSYGCHENYLLDARIHEDILVRNPQKTLPALIPFLVTRQVYAGSGKVGFETGPQKKTNYQISQRVDFIERIYGLETMHARPIINTREEHHADADRFRRLHLILGDANMCEFAGFLKLGSTQILLAMIEESFIDDDLAIKDPLAAIKQVSADPYRSLLMVDGRKLSPVQIQRQFLKNAEKFRQTEAAALIPEYDFILECWSDALDGLDQLVLSPEFDIEDDPCELSRRLDWLLKLWMIQRIRKSERHSWDHSQCTILDLQYHNIDPSHGIFYRLQNQNLAESVLDESLIRRRVREAPQDTRAYFRGKCLEKFPKEIYLVNWEVVGFDQGDVYRMIPLLNPLKGTRSQFENTFERSRNAQELISELETKRPI